MDSFNRYLMRPSGETRFQPRGPREAAAFAVADLLKREGVFDAVFVDGKDDVARSALLDELGRSIGSAWESRQPRQQVVLGYQPGLTAGQAFTAAVVLLAAFGGLLVLLG